MNIIEQIQQCITKRKHVLIIGKTQTERHKILVELSRSISYQIIRRRTTGFYSFIYHYLSKAGKSTISVTRYPSFFIFAFIIALCFGRKHSCL
jgi:hypothetical protein